MIAAAPRISSAARVDQVQALRLPQLAELVAFRTVSADSGTAPAMRTCAAWLRRRVRRVGFATRTVEAGGRPIAVLAERPGESGRELLVYAHFDVQPPGPERAWRSPPFRLSLGDGRARGRGVSDNKGPLHMLLLAIERLVSARHPLPTLRLWLDGEEEVGSPHRDRLLAQFEGSLRSDLVLVVDSPVAADGRPRLVTSFRGRLGADIRMAVLDPGRRHAGLAAGVAGDPAARLAIAIAGIADASGRAALPGSGTGSGQSIVVTSLVAGDAEHPPSGIAEAARATLDIRLPPGVPPRPVADALRRHAARIAATPPPVGATARVTGAIPGVALSLPRATESLAADTIRSAWGVGPAREPSGGSIAAVAALVGAWQLPVLALGLAGLDDAAHGPNESISLERLVRIERTVRLVLEGLAT